MKRWIAIKLVAVATWLDPVFMFAFVAMVSEREAYKAKRGEVDIFIGDELL